MAKERKKENCKWYNKAGFYCMNKRKGILTRENIAECETECKEFEKKEE